MQKLVLLVLAFVCCAHAVVEGPTGSEPTSCVVGDSFVIDDIDPEVVAPGWERRNSFPNWQYAGGFKTNDEKPIPAEVMFNNAAFPSGTYKVTVFFPASPSRPRRAVYVITHDQGSTRRLVNQQLQPRNLSDFDIGTYSFGGFDGQKIRLEPVTGNKVVVDAFLFTCVGPRSSRPVVTPPPVTTPSTASTTTRLPNTGPTPPAVIANAVPLTDVSNPNNNNGQTCVPGQRFTLDEASAQVQKFGAWASKEMPNVAYLRNFMSTEGLPNLRALFRTSGLPRGLYTVTLFYPMSSTRSPRAPHTVVHDGGSNLILVNQETFQPTTLTSYSLGTYSFGGGPNQGVQVTSADDADKVVIDAVTFTCVAPTAPPS